MHLTKSAALFMTAALFACALYSNDPHRVRVALVVEKGVLKAGLVDDSNKLLMRTTIDSVPVLNWAIASAISLKTELRIIEHETGSFVGVGECGSAWEFLIDARLLRLKTDAAGTTYWFKSGERKLKIFTQDHHSDTELRSKLEMAQLFGGFLAISSRHLAAAQWDPGQPSRTHFDSTAWRISPQADVKARVVLYSDFELVAVDGDNLVSRPLYWADKLPSRQITLSEWQLEFMRDVLFPLQRRKSGVVACLRPLCPTSDSYSSRRTCLHFEPGVLPGTIDKPAGFPPPREDPSEPPSEQESDAPMVSAVVAGVTSFISGLLK